MILLVDTALAANQTVRGDRPIHAVIHHTEKVYRCASDRWTLLGQEPAVTTPDGTVGATSSWSVSLCGETQMLTVTRSGAIWGFRTDIELRGLAPGVLGCEELAYRFVDPLTREVTGCGVTSTWKDSGPVWVRVDPVPE